MAINLFYLYSSQLLMFYPENDGVTTITFDYKTLKIHLYHSKVHLRRLKIIKNNSTTFILISH